jgi:hypothetical protein
MNIRRGLIRLWLVCSALFVVAVFGLSYDRLINEFQDPWWDVGILMIPIKCEQTRGIKTVDYTNDIGRSDHCWYELPKFRKHFPEYMDLSDADLSDRLYQKAGMETTRRDPRGVLLNSLGIALGIPVAILLISSAFFWAFAGFGRGNNQ